MLAAKNRVTASASIESEPVRLQKRLRTRSESFCCMPGSLAVLLVFLITQLLASTSARAANGLGELEEPGQPERRPIERSEPGTRDVNGQEVGKARIAEAGSKEESVEEADVHPEEATTILPDGEAIDETIEETAEETEKRVAKEEDRDVPETPKVPGSPEPSPARPQWTIRWQNAFIVERVDDPRYQFLFGGKLQNDWGVYAPDNDLDRSFGGQGTGTKFRRARLYFQGQFFRYGFFKAEYDFSGGSDGTEFSDVYAGLNLPKIGLLRVGYFKEPFSLDFLNSSNFISFNERAAPFALVPGRNSGIMLNGNFLIRDSTYALAFMRRTDDLGEGFSSKEDYHVTARLTGLPYFEKGGARLLHIELGYSHQFADKKLGTRYEIGPANDFAPTIVDTGEGALDVDSVDLFNAGFAVVEGPFSIQSEFTASLPNGGISENPVFWGAYAELSWWLTGENRRYLRGRGVFSRVVPNRRFDPETGHWGAFEIATRYSWLDLSNDGIRGGTLEEWSFALNWVLFSNFRVSNNYVLSRTGDRPDAESGIAHSWVTRIQIDF
jgi:phosphate-selective porin OprO/OprP